VDRGGAGRGHRCKPCAPRRRSAAVPRLAPSLGNRPRRDVGVRPDGLRRRAGLRRRDTRPLSGERLEPARLDVARGGRHTDLLPSTRHQAPGTQHP
jgi:hypothetical protein